MKKLLIFVLMLLFLLPSCKGNTETVDSSRTAYATDRAQANGVIWKKADQLHSSFDSIRWYNPATGKTGSLHADPICAHGLEEQNSCPLAGKSVMNIAAQGNTVWFLSWGDSMTEDLRCSWYGYDFAAQKMWQVSIFEDTSYLPLRWCVADGFLWYSHFEDPSFGDGKIHIRRTPADGSGLDEEAEDMTPGGLDDCFDFYVDGGELFVERTDGSVCRMSDGRIWEHVLIVRDGFVYQTRNTRPREMPADLPEEERETTLRVFDLWRTPIDGGDGDAVLLAEATCSTPQFFEDQIVVTTTNPRFLYSYLPEKRSGEEDRIFGVDLSGGRCLIFDAASGERTGEVVTQGIHLYGYWGAGEDWIVISGLDCTGLEPEGELRHLEGLTQNDMEERTG
ncbi:MAG: hypothetical protein J6V24_01600, partial [Clostridia bacterium]|nr:hypothetical protein [Clostridia bacterium]